VVFHLGWARGFSRKNLVFSIFANIYFLPSQEQSVQIGLLTVCENLATCEKTQFTPLLYLVLLKLNIEQRESIELAFYMWFGMPKEPPRVFHTNPPATL